MISIDRLYAEEIGALLISSDGTATENLPSHPLVLAGSFNPLHDGHRSMLSAASQIVDRPAYYEISIVNVDKPVLPPVELEKRIAPITSDGSSLIVTSAPRFTEKSSIIPGATFVIGFDTYIRLMDKQIGRAHV